MSSNILSFAGWYFLPNLVTGYVQTALYAIFVRAGDPKPAPGSARFARDRRRIHVAVILAYLLYTVFEADHQLRLAGDFYRALGVGHAVDERALQSRFRRLTVQFHPDKAAAGADRGAVEALYVQLKLARDTLVEPARRFAYDRLGPDVLLWPHCKTRRDFILAGAQRAAAYYGGSAAVLALLAVLGYLRAGMFWRFLVMAALFLFELHLMTRPHFPALLTRLVNPLLAATALRDPFLPFQLVALLRQLALTFFIALVQLGPVIHGPPAPEAADGGVAPQQLDRVEALAKATDVELTRLMGLEVMPFAGEPAATRDLRTSLREWLIHNTVRNDAEVKGAIARVLDRRRRGTAAAAPPE